MKQLMNQSRISKHNANQRSGFSLLELLVASIVMSIICVVVMPLIMSSTDAYAVARDTRSDSDRVLYALDRAARIVRETPFAADDSGLDVQTASSTQFILTDGSGFRLSGTDFELLKPGGQASLLCEDVSKIQLTYFDGSGNPLVIVNPAQVHRVNLRIQSGLVVLEMYALPRSWIGMAES
tara:strand:+ start:1411 stop:1953 length:543 start_codon:yes stop_codon:yes gene_type:complete